MCKEAGVVLSGDDCCVVVNEMNLLLVADPLTDDRWRKQIHNSRYGIVKCDKVMRGDAGGERTTMSI